MKREKCQSFPLYLLHVTRVYFLWVSSEGPCLFVALNDKEPPFINSWIRHCTLCSFLYILKHRHILFCYFAEWLNIGTSRNRQNICKTKTVTKLFVRVSARSSVCSFFCLSVCLFVLLSVGLSVRLCTLLRILFCHQNHLCPSSGLYRTCF